MFKSDLIDTVVICPYDKNHRINRSRIQKHIIKCEKNYPPNYKIICPHNATHRLCKSEAEQHIASCHKQSPLKTTDDETRQEHLKVISDHCNESINMIDCRDYSELTVRHDFSHYIEGAAFGNTTNVTGKELK